MANLRIRVSDTWASLLRQGSTRVLCEICVPPMIYDDKGLQFWSTANTKAEAKENQQRASLRAMNSAAESPGHKSVFFRAFRPRARRGVRSLLRTSHTFRWRHGFKGTLPADLPALCALLSKVFQDFGWKLLLRHIFILTRYWYAKLLCKKAFSAWKIGSESRLKPSGTRFYPLNPEP